MVVNIINRRGFVPSEDLSSSNELIEFKKDVFVKKYVEFRGVPSVIIPEMIQGKYYQESEIVDVPRKPVSISEIIYRRLKAPEDVILNWQNNSFSTGDSCIFGKKGDAIIVLDDKAITEITRSSSWPLDKENYFRMDERNGYFMANSLLLSDSEYNSLKFRSQFTKSILYLSAEKLNNVNAAYKYNKGFIKKNDVWIPENRTIGEVWDFFCRGASLDNYVNKASQHTSRNDDKIMKIELEPRIIKSEDFNVAYPLSINKFNSQDNYCISLVSTFYSGNREPSMKFIGVSKK